MSFLGGLLPRHPAIFKYKGVLNRQRLLEAFKNVATGVAFGCAAVNDDGLAVGLQDVEVIEQLLIKALLIE